MSSSRPRKTKTITVVTYTCNLCSAQFPSKQEFVKHHRAGQTHICCKCPRKFRNMSELYAHFERHRNETPAVLVDENNEVVEEIVLRYEDGDDENDLLYVLEDDSQCVNEVVIEEDELRNRSVEPKPDNLTIVQLEHGYVIPNQQAKEAKKAKMVVPSPRPRAALPKRRHVVPDFSATNYLYISPNEEVDIPHYKCLRCEQLFINKFGFFRHIEKGKCYINNCDVCNASFDKNSEFYYHYLAEHTDRAICNFCFRTFMYEKNVKEHMLRHLDQFRHKCEECSKGFYTVREYRNHYKNRHMGIRHVCTVCSRTFADEYYFKRHIATHEQASVVVIE